MRTWCLLGVLLTACRPPTHVQRITEAPPGSIVGMVYDTRNDEPVPDALLVLQSTAIEGSQERVSGPDGSFAFTELPPGVYTVQLLIGMTDKSVVTTLVEEGPGFVAEIGVDPTFRRSGCKFGPPPDDLDVSLFSEPGDKRRY